MTDQVALPFDEKIEFLGKLDIFANLDADELRALAKISKQYAFAKDAVILHQGDVADQLFIVQQGRIEAVSINQEGVSRRETQYLPYDYFDDVWLFNPGNHPASIRARQDGRLITIPSKAFLEFLARHKHALDNLTLTDDAIAELEKTPLTHAERRYRALKLVPEELIELETRRSRWVLAGKLFFPVLGLLTIPAGLFYLLASSFDNLANSWLWGLAGLFAVIFLLWIGFQWLDWYNDYLVITNKRLVHYEFNLRALSIRGKDTLIDQVQSVETTRPNLLSTLLNLGTARVTTAAQTVLFFDYLDEPERIEQIVSAIRSRTRALNEGEFKATMRQSIENYFEITDPLVKLDEEIPKDEPDESAVRSIWKSIKSFRIYRYRTEEGGVVTFRKHIFALLVEIIWPLGIALILGIALFVLSRLQLDNYVPVVIIIGLLNFLWLIWLTEDWRNDTFQITERYVIDIDRKPFGFGESRKQARLDNIQEVKADRPNFLATLFNFGNVEVETAGADSNIVFENVSNPGAIRNDIFKRRAKFEEQLRKNKAEQERKQYAVLLDVFMQERELERVKRRTPNFDEVEEEHSDFYQWNDTE